MKNLKKLFKLIPVFCVAFVSGLSAVLSNDQTIKSVKADDDRMLYSTTFSPSNTPFNVASTGTNNATFNPALDTSVFNNGLSYYRSVTNEGVSYSVNIAWCYQLSTVSTGIIQFDSSTWNIGYNVYYPDVVKSVGAQRINQINYGDFVGFTLGGFGRDLTRFRLQLTYLRLYPLSYGHIVSGYSTGGLDMTFRIYIDDTYYEVVFQGLRVLSQTSIQTYYVNKSGTPLYSIFDITYTPSVTDDSYADGYDDGYGSGYNDGFNVGYSSGSYDGYSSGYESGFTAGSDSREQDITNAYNEGYNAGYDNGLSVDDTAATIFSGILQIGLVPINFFLAIFNFEILGINLSAFVSALLTVCLTIIVIKTITGKNGGD